MAQKETAEEKTNLLPSKLGEVLTGVNTLCTKQLQETVKNIELCRSSRETDLFLQQRAFFISSTFDNNNEVRFAKVRQQRHLRHLEELKRTILSSKKADQENFVLPTLNSSASGLKVRASTSLLDKLYLEHIPTLHMDSMNMQKIAYAEQRMSLQRSAMQKQMGETKFCCISKNTSYEENEAETITHESPRQQITKKKISLIPVLRRSNILKRSMASSVSSNTTESPQVIRKKAMIRVMIQRPLTCENLRLFEEETGPEHSHKRHMIEKLLASDCLGNEDTEVPQLPHLLDSSQIYRTPPCGQEDSIKSRQERLIKRLTKSLPVHMLQETEQIQSTEEEESRRYLKSVLGIKQMKDAMLKRERALATAGGHSDPRFSNLVQSLHIPV